MFSFTPPATGVKVVESVANSFLCALALIWVSILVATHPLRSGLAPAVVVVAVSGLLCVEDGRGVVLAGEVPVVVHADGVIVVIVVAPPSFACWSDASKGI